MSDISGFTAFGVICAVAICYFLVSFVGALVICAFTDTTDMDMVYVVAYLLASVAFILVMTQYILGVPCPIKI